MKNYLLFSLFSFVCFSCNHLDSKEQQVIKASFENIRHVESETDLVQFNNYWHQGKAEITRYELSQNRYGDNHPGEAILIFVTEDFLVDKQVKNDQNINSNSTSILKNNMIREFSTGIYDYSMMTSVFTPVNRNKYPHTLKITTSSQDWCGQTFEQINLKKKKYQVESRSYFESESDKNFELNTSLLEDELFNRIRLDPTSLPVGTIKMIPSTQVSRLMHLKIKDYLAEANNNDYKGIDFKEKNLSSYKLYFPELKRTLEIIYENSFPHKIIGWTDSYPSMFDKKMRKTIATKTHESHTAYWQQNRVEDMKFRANLGR